MKARVSTWQQIWPLVQLKYRLNRRDFMDARLRKVSALAVIRTLIFLAFAVYISLRMYRYLTYAANSIDPEQIVASLTQILAVLFIYHTLAPLNVFRTRRELDIQRLLPLPLGFPTLIAARSAASLIDPGTLYSFVSYGAVVAALGLQPFLVPALLLLLAFFALAMVLGQIVYTAIEVAYYRHWFREVLFAGLMCLAGLGIVAAFFVIGNAPEKQILFEKWQAVVTGIPPWLPSSWTAHAIGELERGNYLTAGGVFLALTGIAGALVWISGKALAALYYRRGYDREAPERRAGETVSGRLQWLERLVSRETMAMLIKELLVFRRSPWWFLTLVASPLFIVGIALFVPALRHPSLVVMLAFAAGGAVETLQGMNFLATEGQALPLLLTLPASRRSMLQAKTLRLLLTVFVEMAIDLTLYAILIQRLRYLPAMLILNVGMDLVALTMLAAVSVMYPRQGTAFEFLPRMSLYSFLACIVGATVGGLPIIGLIWLIGQNPGALTIACVLSLTYGLLFYRLGITLVGNYLERKEKDILAKLVT